MLSGADEYREPIHILHVDDELDFAEMASSFLEREDDRFTVEIAPSAADGLDRLADATFDCIVSDHDMPGQNGIEFLQTVREEHPNLPFILFTGKGSETVASEAISAGVTDYLQKESVTDQYTLLANRIVNAVAATRMNAEVMRARKQLGRIIETVPECIVQLNDKGEFVFANERATEVLGIDRSKLTNRTYNDPEWDLRDPKGEPIPDEELPYQQVWESGEPVRGYRLTISCPDDSDKILRVDGVPMDYDEGNIERAVFALSDITDNWERQKRLQRTKARLEALFERSPDMLNVHDADGTIIDVNPRLCEQTGYSETELVGMKIWELDETITSESVRAGLTDMNVGERRELEGRFRRRDESTFPVEINVRRIEIGSDDQFVVISRDITDRKQRERELEQRTDELEQLTAQFQEQYRYLFEEAPVMIVETRAEDGTPMIEDCNQRFVDTLGYNKADVVGQPLAEFYVAESEQRLLDEGGYARSLRGEFTREDRELVAADGEPLETLLRAVPRYDINDAIVGTIAFYVDISDQKELQRENDRLDQFTSVVSHDLRNPLNVAQGYLDLARETCDTDHLDQVADAHDRMNALIEDVLTLAREGKAVTDTETIDLAVLTERCWRNVATAEATLETDLSRSLEADEGRLQQLLENLIRNAVEYGGTDVTVTIVGLQDGFYVADDGPGIPEDHLDDVLTPGYSTSEEGTGFGLAIVKEVADAHGWETAVSNGSKGGARIEVTGVEFTSA